MADRQVLDRESGRVEQRDLLVRSSTWRHAGQHLAQLRHFGLSQESRLDGAGQLAAVRGLLPLVAEDAAARYGVDVRLGLPRSVGPQHVEVEAGAEVARGDDPLVTRRDTRDDV